MEEANLTVLDSLAGCLGEVGPHFVVGGDFQCDPRTVEEAGVCGPLGATLFPPSSDVGTCRGRTRFSTIDMWLASASMAAATIGADVVTQVGCNPHRPIHITIDGDWAQLQAMAFPQKRPCGRERIVGPHPSPSP